MPRFSGIFDRGALNLFCNAYDHAASLAAGVDIGVGLAHLREGVAPVDDRPQCSGFRKFGQVPSIFGPFFRRPAITFLLAGHRRPQRGKQVTQAA